MVAPGAGGGGDGGAAAGAAEEEKQEEKDAFDVKLVSFEDKSKIKVIKEVGRCLSLPPFLPSSILPSFPLSLPLFYSRTI
jgi:hypothetical protein